MTIKDEDFHCKVGARIEELSQAHEKGWKEALSMAIALILENGQVTLANRLRDIRDRGPT